MTGAADDGSGEGAAVEPALRIEVLRGNPDADELAAAVAVVSESYRSEAAAAVADDTHRRSAWQLSARVMRQPLRRDIGWGRFGG